ncbi:MAG TPA: o-succinylbenzoate synthase [Vicinamibacterales bacterium]|nr:o-succinylbenzoate synthase [Vicinamibacterales bacterium]
MIEPRPIDTPARLLTVPSPIALDAIEVRLLRLPLVRPFETSFGRMESRLVVLTRIEAEGVSGWGEIAALEEPLYTYETPETAREVVGRHFAPALLHGELRSLDDFTRRLARFRGHPMARAGLDLAWMDLVARLHHRPLSELLGGTRALIDVGVSLGIEPSIESLSALVDDHVALGYQRIKLKIKPGWDVDVVRAIRARHPRIQLSVDANTAYEYADVDHLRRLDEFQLLMIEQPLEHDDLIDHARLQREIATAICLDESITNERRAEQAIEAGSCRIINVKVGRVGGYAEALAIHDRCMARHVPVWCGGMLESGVGRAHNIALASLPNFTLPGDISASSRYYARDIVDPPVVLEAGGRVAVPTAPGIGVEIDLAYVSRQTASVDRHTRTTVVA